MELAVPKVLAWKCPYTGELFEDEKKYKNHLAKLARYRREQRKLQIAEDAAQSWWTEFQNIEMDISELPKLIIENQDKFWAESNRADRWNWQQIGQTRKGVIMPTPKLVKFTKFDLRWSDSVSNTHNCPKNGSTNWGGNRSDLPRGYPGWTGHIEWQIEWPKEWDGWYPGSDLFAGHRACIHTGTGGGGFWSKGYQSFGYGVNIFAADWPGLNRFREKKVVWEVLSTP